MRSAAPALFRGSHHGTYRGAGGHRDQGFALIHWPTRLRSLVAGSGKRAGARFRRFQECRLLYVHAREVNRFVPPTPPLLQNVWWRLPSHNESAIGRLKRGHLLAVVYTS